MSQPTWFSRPRDPEGVDGTLNLAYDLLDRQIVAGRADDAALTHPADAASYAVLLEQVAGFGGLLGALGVDRGDAVAVAAPVSPESVVAVLAVARIGAAAWIGGAPDLLVEASDAALVVAEGSQMPAVAPVVDALSVTRPRATVVVRPGEWDLIETRDVAWDLALKAGASDPAPVVPTAAGAPVVVNAAASSDGATAGAVSYGALELVADGDARTGAGLDGVPLGSVWTVDLVRRLVSALSSGQGMTLTER